MLTESQDLGQDVKELVIKSERQHKHREIMEDKINRNVKCADEGSIIAKDFHSDVSLATSVMLTLCHVQQQSV